jgi:hypothetical protein
MEIGNSNYQALVHVIGFIIFLWILAILPDRNKDE